MTNNDLKEGKQYRVINPYSGLPKETIVKYYGKIHGSYCFEIIKVNNRHRVSYYGHNCDGLFDDSVGYYLDSRYLEPVTNKRMLLLT